MFLCFSILYSGIAFYKVFIIIFLVLLFVSLIIKIINRYILKFNNIEEIYIRDVDVKYSPAVLSYLINNKIETRKDLSATLLNLCVKNVLKIETNERNEINIVDLKNEDEIAKLSDDEKYAYHMFVDGITRSKILSWKIIVEKEYKKYKFSKKHKMNLIECFVAIWFIFIFSMPFWANYFEIDDEVLWQMVITLFLSAFIVNMITLVRQTFRAIINEEDKSEFRDIYTKKGATEYNKWKRFEKFIQDYTLINDKNYNSFVIWGKYLSYSIALGINKKCDREIYNQINKKYSFKFEDFEKIYDENKISE